MSTNDPLDQFIVDQAVRALTERLYQDVIAGKVTVPGNLVGTSPPGIDWQAMYNDLAVEFNALVDALTPSATTKAWYIGEFTFETGEGMSRYRHQVPWDTVKEILAKIRTCAQLAPDAHPISGADMMPAINDLPTPPVGIYSGVVAPGHSRPGKLWLDRVPEAEGLDLNCLRIYTSRGWQRTPYLWDAINQVWLVDGEGLPNSFDCAPLIGQLRAKGDHLRLVDNRLERFGSKSTAWIDTGWRYDPAEDEFVDCVGRTWSSMHTVRVGVDGRRHIEATRDLSAPVDLRRYDTGRPPEPLTSAVLDEVAVILACLHQGLPVRAHESTLEALARFVRAAYWHRVQGESFARQDKD